MKQKLLKISPILILTFLILSITLQPASYYVNAQYPGEQIRLTIEINNQAGGMTSPSPGISYYDYGLSVQVTVLANPGYQFTGWYLNGIYQHKLSTITITILQQNVLMATFSQDATSLTISANPVEGGTTNPSPGTLSFSYGSSVLVIAQPHSGYIFEGWYLDGVFSGTSTEFTVSMGSNRDLQAYFSSTSASPSPTTDPTPTPPPLPPATIEASVESSATFSDFSAKINGVLTAGGTDLPNAGILLYLSVSGGASWDILSFVNTDPEGKFSIIWKPSVTGNYLLNATWNGNLEYSSTSTIVNFALTPYEEQNVFSITSNSTLSGLLFDSVNNELRFTVDGPSGSVGYVNAVIPKSLLDDISTLNVNVDQYQITFNSESQTEYWTISFTYPHSTHEITVDFNANPTTPSDGNFFNNPIIYLSALAAIIVIIISTVVIGLRRKKVKNPTKK